MTTDDAEKDESMTNQQGRDEGRTEKIELGTEPINDPPRRLDETLAANGIAPGRFRTLDAGQGWAIPEL